MYCTKCGQRLRDNVNFCDNCGTPVATLTETAPTVKKETHVALKVEDEKIKIKHDKKATSVIGKIFIAAIISLVIGLITYPISNSVLEVAKKDLSWEDYPFQQKLGADNAALRREVLTAKSFENAKIATIFSFIIVLAFIFIRIENKEKNVEINEDKAA